MADTPDYSANPDTDDENGLATIQSDGDVPDRRISTASVANQIAANLWWADQQAAIDRSFVDSQSDGFPPMDQENLRADGIGNSTNVNFLGACGKEATSLASYNDLFNSTEKLIQCVIETGPKEKRQEKAAAFAEEYTRLMRFDWPDFVPNNLYLARHFIRHGVSIAYRPDSIDWRWKVSRLGDFQVQRRQNCSVDDMELASMRSFENPNTVYDYIRDVESAKKLGWNVKATKKAIQNACIPLYNSYGTNGIDPEMWERDAKANSFFWTQGKAKQVELRHFWVKEFDGTVTHLITTPDNDDDFLFEKNGRWDSMTDALCLFTYGVGNGDIYSIRGLGWMLFGSEQLKNVLLCKMANSTMMSLGTVWQANTETGLEDFNSVTWGDMTLVPSSFTFQPIQWPNMGQNALPLLNMIGSMQTANTGTYTPTPSGVGSDVEKTKAQFEGEAAMQAVLSSAAISLFYQALDRLDQMTVRALIKDPYPEGWPGGKERAAFIKRLMDKGLTMEDIQGVSCVRHVRAIGAGSEAVARAKIGNVLSLGPELDPIAKREALRLALINDVGVDNVNNFMPAQGERIPDDKKVAELEGNSFMFGVVPEVMANEIDEVHLAEHGMQIEGAFERLQQGSMPPQAAIETIGSALQHSQMHIQKMGQSIGEDNNSPKAKLLKQINVKFQQYQAEFDKFTANFQQQQQAEQDAQGQQQQNNSAEAMKQKREDAAFQADERRKEEMHQFTLRRLEAETEAKLLAARALTNAELEHKTAKTQAQIHHDSLTTEQQITDKAAKTRQNLAVTDLTTASKLKNEKKNQN